MQKENGKDVINNKAVTLNLIQGLPRLSWLLLRNGMRGRFQIKFGMTPNYNNGFTLIELLVVVLIIGILAAVAVPQYQRAVDKSRLVHFITAVKAVKQAEEVYYLANGSYTTDWGALDISFTGTANGATFTTTHGMTLKLILGGPSTTAKVYATYTKLPDIGLYQVFSHSGFSVHDDKLYCEPLSTKTASHQLCKSMSSNPSGMACGNGSRCYVVDKF